MSYVVVIKKVGDPLAAHSIFQVQDMVALSRRLRVMYGRRDLVAWTPEMDERLRADYYRISTAQIACKMSQAFGRRITKNAVIGRAHQIGVAGRKCGK